ncbi:MAG: M56 family metallopeptidase [Clostridia bacterium]|nr:M56 family metallopeptidase [Clostridia bacterium]
MRTALIFNFLIEANIMASIAIMLMMTLRKFLRKPLGNSAICFGWLLVAARLLLPLTLPNPFIALIRSPFAQDPAIRPIAGQIKVRLHDALSDFAVHLFGANQRSAADRVLAVQNGIEYGTLPIALAQIYLLGVAAVLLWFAFSNVRFCRYLRSGRIEEISGKLKEQYEAMCEARHVKPVPVYFTDPLPSACLVGVFHPYIALPLTPRPQEAIQVLTHEVCHLKNLDPLWNVIRLLCCAVHWFNPLVWIAASMSRTDTELRCDDRVIAPMQQEERQAYANVLLLAASRRNAPGVGVLATGMTMTGKRLKTRVLTILQAGKPLTWLSVGFMVLSSMLLLGAFATAELQPSPRLSATSAFVRQPIETEEDALAYGKSLWSLKELGASNVDQLIWYKGPTFEDPDILSVFGGLTENSYAYNAVFDRQGNLLQLHNGLTDPDNLYASDRYTLTEEEQDRLGDDLLQFMLMMNPEAAEKVTYIYQYSESWMDDHRYVYFTFWQNDRDHDPTASRVGDMIVEIAPVVRIVHFVIGSDEGISGGNG